MKIKRFTGSDMRQAIKHVRDALGEDAVILSNQTTADGVEVVAAIDYDESLLGQRETESTTASFQNDAFCSCRRRWKPLGRRLLLFPSFG